MVENRPRKWPFWGSFLGSEGVILGVILGVGGGHFGGHFRGLGRGPEGSKIGHFWGRGRGILTPGTRFFRSRARGENRKNRHFPNTKFAKIEKMRRI